MKKFWEEDRKGRPKEVFKKKAGESLEGCLEGVNASSDGRTVKLSLQDLSILWTGFHKQL